MALSREEYIKVAKLETWIPKPDGRFEHKNTTEVLSEEELDLYLAEDHKHWLNNNKGNYLKKYR